MEDKYLCQHYIDQVEDQNNNHDLNSFFLNDDIFLKKHYYICLGFFNEYYCEAFYNHNLRSLHVNKPANNNSHNQDTSLNYFNNNTHNLYILYILYDLYNLYNPDKFDNLSDNNNSRSDINDFYHHIHNINDYGSHYDYIKSATNNTCLFFFQQEFRNRKIHPLHDTSGASNNTGEPSSVNFVKQFWANTWPSVYLDLAGLSAERPCGSTTKTVGAPTNTRLAFHPTEINTYTWTSSILNVSSTKENDGLFGSWTVFWDTSTQRMNWADLAGCTRVSTGYAFPASAQVQTAYITDPHDALLTPPFGTNKCEPLLAIPTKVMNSRPEWTTCFPDATGANFDPPYSIILAESGFESTPEVRETFFEANFDAGADVNEPKAGSRIHPLNHSKFSGGHRDFKVKACIKCGVFKQRIHEPFFIDENDGEY
ncbi:hypothetical protein GTA08_BOTSDO08401 [Botryosphaeria dothidea]|uniref:Uncharacterized protein n=1 Tax=Botryosphaeria dothidea TaxID=55169 RepID=A0A8H4IPM8_9PEZI|nr:hypothetical protein GTA08_BOTSDO08401 [Botryosphaeria dothidea]